MELGDFAVNKNSVIYYNSIYLYVRLYLQLQHHLFGMKSTSVADENDKRPFKDQEDGQARRLTVIGGRDCLHSHIFLQKETKNIINGCGRNKSC